MRSIYIFLASISLGAALGSTAKADVISITLDSFALSGSPNSFVTYTGTLQNNSGAEVFLNGAGGDLSYSELTLDLSPFFTFTPLSIPDGGSYNGPLFAVAISAVAQSGNYSGTFTIQGGPDSSVFDTVGTADFQVGVSSSVPEPSLTLLLCTSIGTLLILRRRCLLMLGPLRNSQRCGRLERWYRPYRMWTGAVERTIKTLAKIERGR